MTHNPFAIGGSIILVAGALGLATTLSAAADEDPFGGKVNHYQCYAIVDGAPPKAELKLKDQFREDVADIVAARFLCNPVDKNGEGIPDEKVHLVCFEIKVRNPDDKTYGVDTVNQLGKNRYFVRGPQLVCIPSLKERTK